MVTIIRNRRGWRNCGASAAHLLKLCDGSSHIRTALRTRLAASSPRGCRPPFPWVPPAVHSERVAGHSEGHGGAVLMRGHCPRNYAVLLPAQYNLRSRATSVTLHSCMSPSATTAAWPAMTTRAGRRFSSRFRPRRAAVTSARWPGAKWCCRPLARRCSSRCSKSP